MTHRGIAILAAGGSRRLGRPKQLVCVEGVPLVRRIAALARAVRCEHDTAVVLGCEAARVAAALQGAACERIDNPDWSEGIASSIRVAVRWAQARDHDALMLLVCDQVLLTTEHLEQLWTAWAAHPGAAVASAYSGTLGVPAIFPRACFASLLALRGERGAAKLLQAPGVTQVPWADGASDLDTPGDLAMCQDGHLRPADND